MSDAFFEVDEQLRSERLRSAFAKGWPYALAALLVALVAGLAIWGWTAWQDKQSARASDTYGQGLDLLAKGDGKGADARFAEVAQSGTGPYRALALMQQGGIRLADHKDAQAVALLDKAATVATNPILADAAKLKAAYVLMDSKPLSVVQPRLTPLSDSSRPFHWLAREALGLAKLQAGDLKGARGEFAVLTLGQDVSEPSRQRARAAMALIDDGSAVALASLVKAGLAAPPAPPPGLPGVPGPAPAAPAGSAQ